jgi:hypothetical protein
MKNFRAADKTHAGGDEKHDINFHWPCSNVVNLSSCYKVVIQKLLQGHFKL